MNIFIIISLSAYSIINDFDFETEQTIQKHGSQIELYSAMLHIAVGATYYFLFQQYLSSLPFKMLL